LTDRNKKVVIKSINDLPQSVSCKVSLYDNVYADDTLLYAEVNNKIHQKAFQRDLNLLYSSLLKCKMSFKTNKYEVIIFGKIETPPIYIHLVTPLSKQLKRPIILVQSCSLT